MRWFFGGLSFSSRGMLSTLGRKRRSAKGEGGEMKRRSGREVTGSIQDGRGSRADDSTIEAKTEKIPMSIDDVAMLAASVARGGQTSHPLAYQAMGMACGSVRRLVYKMALKYSGTCKTDPEDLVQECMKRIVTRIGDFDVRRGKFTTWSSTVASSVLNGFYRRQSGWNKHIVPMDSQDIKGDIEPRTEPDSVGLLRMDIFDAVGELVKQHPDKKELIMGMFGNPDRSGFKVPSKVMVAEAAERAGMGRPLAMEFFKSVVQPFFIRRFSDNPNDEAPLEPLPEKVPGVSVVDAALEVLKAEARPMLSRELYSAATSRGLYSSDAGNPYVSFCSVLGKAVLRGDKRLCRVGKAMWEAA